MPEPDGFDCLNVLGGTGGTSAPVLLPLDKPPDDTDEDYNAKTDVNENYNDRMDINDNYDKITCNNDNARPPDKVLLDTTPAFQAQTFDSSTTSIHDTAMDTTDISDVPITTREHLL